MGTRLETIRISSLYSIPFVIWLTSSPVAHACMIWQAGLLPYSMHGAIALRLNAGDVGIKRVKQEGKKIESTCGGVVHPGQRFICCKNILIFQFRACTAQQQETTALPGLSVVIEVPSNSTEYVFASRRGVQNVRNRQTDEGNH